ncbi:MAG: PP2C family protein-serine/threonine phosphatase [Propionibacteriaceae bacterium]
MNDTEKGWQRLLPDGLERWLKGKDPADGPGDPTPGVEWRPVAGAPAPGVSSPDPSLRYEPPGVEWTPAATIDPDADVAPPRPCMQCGGAVDGDGYCTVCGFKAVSERDHYREEPAPWVAGVCDRGLRHSRNEDAMALGAAQEPGGRAVLVVCDGVSSSIDSDVAALAGAEAARDLLITNQPQGMGVEASRSAAMQQALTQAAAAANEAVVAKTDPASQNAASATFVAAVVSDGRLFYANLGDSRAYWVPDAGKPVQLSADDSVAQAKIEAGFTREEAENGPGAHAITRWLGRDAPDIHPRCGELEVNDGWLLVCSDGLWNYASGADEIGTVLAAGLASSPSNLVDVCEHMVAWANAQGGKDNITVAIARLGDLQAFATAPPASAEEPASPDSAPAALVPTNPENAASGGESTVSA